MTTDPINRKETAMNGMNGEIFESDYESSY